MKNMLPILMILFCAKLLAQRPAIDPQLQKKLEEITRSFNGEVGIYVRHLGIAKEAAIHADSLFPTASIVKVPILIGLMDRIEKGNVSLSDSLVYTKDRIYGGSGLMQFFRDSTVTDIRTLASLMVSHSDNVTSIWCQELAGGGALINPLMENLGMHKTRVNSRTPGREADWEQYGWGQTTPREMATLLVKIRKRALVSPAASDLMYRMLSNSFYTDYGLSRIPPYIQVASKQGMVNRSRSELVMVNGPSGDYVFYIATKNNEDTSWAPENEAWELQRKISALLWEYFEPGDSWTPASGADELLKGLRY